MEINEEAIANINRALRPLGNGHLSRRAGHHQLTDVEGKKIEALAKEAWDRTPEMSKKWKSATFHFAPER